jgi:hypothetical protein
MDFITDIPSPPSDLEAPPNFKPAAFLSACVGAKGVTRSRLTIASLLAC